MGNGAITCCEATSSMLDEMKMSSPRNSKPSNKASIYNEVSSIKNIYDSKNLENANSHFKLKQPPLNPPIMQIKVVNSGPIRKDTRFTITYLGLENSKRRANDGKTFFGCKRKENSVTVNDIIISLQDKQLEDHHRGRHFFINYNIEKNSYWIKDLGKGFGAYVRLDYSMVRPR